MRIYSVVGFSVVLLSCGESKDARMEREVEAQYESCNRWTYKNKLDDKGADKYCDKNWFKY